MLADPGSAALIERRILGRRAKRREHREQIVAEIVIFLIDLPADPRRLKPLGISGPAIGPVAQRMVFGHVGTRRFIFPVIAHLRVAADAAAAVTPGEDMQPVGVSLRHRRAMIGVAHGKGVGERVIEWQIARRIMQHAGVKCPVMPPAIIATAIEDMDVFLVRLFGTVDFERSRRLRIAVERQDIAVGMLMRRLRENAAAPGQAQRAWIAEAADTVQHAEIMVEGAILLHVDHDMLDVADRPGAPVRRDRERAVDQTGQHRSGRARTGHAQKMPSRCPIHGFALSLATRMR